MVSTPAPGTLTEKLSFLTAFRFFIPSEALIFLVRTDQYILLWGNIKI